MARLHIRKPHGGNIELQVKVPVCSIGRALDNAIVLEDSGVSRWHAQLQFKDGVYTLEDLGSHNGTFVNGRKIGTAALSDRDVVRIGQHVLTFRTADAPLPLPEPHEDVAFEEDYEAIISQVTSSFRRPPPCAADGTVLVSTQREQQTLRVLLELSNALWPVHSVEDVSRRAVQVLLESTNAERGAIFLLAGEGLDLNPAVVCSKDGDPGGRPVFLSSAIASRILTESKGIVTADAAADARFAGHSISDYGIRSVACAPLRGKSGNLGVLYLENNRDVGAFTPDDLRLLCAVAAQISLSIENARFHDALKRSNEELERIVEERTAALRQAQLKVYQTEKMASLSRLVAGVVHEINSPLGALKSNLELQMVMFGRAATTPGRPKEEATLFEHLVGLGQASVAACARIVGIVRALSSYARLDEAEFKRADINEGLRTVVSLLDPSVRRNIAIHMELGDLPPVDCYPALLNEAFMNLLVNACQAIPKEGEVRISTRLEGEHALIIFRDTGTGIAPELLGRIFEPGFTTKRVRVGVGLGLAVVYSVIQEHRGTIEVQSNPEEGTTFTIRVPTRDSAQNVAQPAGG